MKRILLIAAVLAGVVFGQVFAEVYKVNAAASKLSWLGQKVTGEHHGEIKIKDGYLTVDGNKYSGEFTIDMITIVNHDLEGEWNAKLIGHLKSDDFFSVEKHPAAAFKVTKVVPYKAEEGEAATHRVTGDLTIKGITNEISFPAQFTFTDEGLTARAKFSIDRTKWDIRFRSGSFFENLGDKLIYDDIKFDLTLVADKAEDMSLKTH